MEHIFFMPYIGKNYYSGGIFGKRILILGESHYCDELCADCGMPCHKAECGNFTTNVMQRFLYRSSSYERWMSTFTKFERSLVNRFTDEEQRREIWDSVLFYNYLQVAMTEAREKGNDEDYVRAGTTFFEVLDTYRPEYIIVWGYRLWNYLPGGKRWAWNEDLIVEGEPIKNGSYLLADNTHVKTIAVKHPSTGYAWDYWYRIINAFITNN